MQQLIPYHIRSSNCTSSLTVCNYIFLYLSSNCMLSMTTYCFRITAAAIKLRKTSSYMTILILESPIYNYVYTCAAH